jgi:hypothetical protein
VRHSESIGKDCAANRFWNHFLNLNMRITQKHTGIPALAEAEKIESFQSSPPDRAYGAAATRWFLAGGLLLFALLLWNTNLAGVANLLSRASVAFPLLFVPYALVVVLEAVGWRFAFPSGGFVRFNDLLRLTIAVKAVQFLTPSIIQAAEFMKIQLLRQSGVGIDIAAASVVLAKTAIMIAEFLFIGLGLSFALGYVTVDRAVALSVTLGLLVMALCLTGGLLLQRAGLFSPVLAIGRRFPFLSAFIDRHEAVLCSTERMVQAHLGERKRFAWSCVWFFMGWAAGIIEVSAFLSMLGLPADAGSAFFIQVWSLVVTRLTTFIPANLGAQEAGTVMTFSLLGLSVESAMAFAVLRRIRQFGWIAVSLGWLTKMSRA